MSEARPVDWVPDDDHVGVSRQYWRDIVLGVNDGLVSMFLLVAGVVGGGLAASQVLVTAVAGAIAGAVSMAFGEYLATKSQDEVLQSEIALEQRHIRDYRSMEVDQLREMMAGMGVSGEDLDTVVEILSRDDGTLLEAMKALEFGVVETERRSPYMAAVWSGVLFILGSLPSVLPFAMLDDARAGLVWAGALAGVALFVVGVVKTRVTRGNPLRAGLENLVVAGLGGLVAFGVGTLFDTTVA